MTFVIRLYTSLKNQYDVVWGSLYLCKSVAALNACTNANNLVNLLIVPVPPGVTLVPLKRTLSPMDMHVVWSLKWFVGDALNVFFVLHFYFSN